MVWCGVVWHGDLGFRASHSSESGRPSGSQNPGYSHHRCKRTQTYTLSTHTHTHKHTQTHTNTHTKHTHAQTHTNTHTKHTQTHYKHIHTHIHTQTHTHEVSMMIHIHMHLLGYNLVFGSFPIQGSRRVKRNTHTFFTHTNTHI